MTGKEFGKRTFTTSAFIAHVREVADHMGDLRAAARAGRVSKAFVEKIMLAVTQVNGCRYCNYGHARLALEAGVPPEELRQLMAGEFDGLPEEELVALAFAQHYAEQGGRPTSEAWQRLLDAYGQNAARDIMAYIRMITFGNMVGNALDALLTRLSLRPVPGSRFRDEVGILLLTMSWAPLMFLKGMLARRSPSQPHPARALYP
jgi:AhpD family alkylhydroperoxidase